GSGKTTLAAICRSMTSGDPGGMVKRKSAVQYLPNSTAPTTEDTSNQAAVTPKPPLSLCGGDRFTALRNETKTVLLQHWDVLDKKSTEAKLIRFSDEVIHEQKKKVEDCLKTEETAVNEFLLEYQQRVNDYLQKFCADFQLQNLRINPVRLTLMSDIHQIRTITYDITAKNPLPTSNPINAEFLSEGDRSALALAFFLTKLDYAIEDSSSPATRPTLVFDDPVTSFDSHRRDVTIEIIRDLLFNDAISQAIVLSHDAHILNDLLISVNKKQEKDDIKTVTTAEFEIKINDIEKTSSLVDKDIVKIAGGRYKACVSALEDYRRGGTDDIGVKANVLVYIRQIIESNLKDRFSELIELKLPVINSRMVGNIIDVVQNESGVKSISGTVTKKEDLITELRQINQLVSSAAHIKGRNDEAKENLMDLAEKTTVLTLHKLIQQTYDIINNKLPLLVYNKKSNPKPTAVCMSTQTD
ncbi:unnamed protein product, partial [Didymodactylos carnosus]